MGEIFTPTDHADAYSWVVVALAHIAVGAVLVGALAGVIALAGPWIESRGRLALVLVVAAYLLIWEIAVQRVGAGWPDALLDTSMIAAGGALGLLTWRRKPAALATVVTAVTLALWNGIRRRRG
jgi:hypothetical protein